MFMRGETYKKWKAMEKADICQMKEAENGCHIEVCARENDDRDVEVFISVYTATGECAYERIRKWPGAEWEVEDALKRGIDQAERIAGGESGRLTCADAHGHDNE
ncbi:hypothetical protein GXB78_03330 [Pseudomonas moraviensis subsp. stanleyae]|uniref:hypothetical protein n=1 Tax=Pseudomonas moraviensis TaxID=321662 RepID=UPI002E32C46E|nr:hypothetical protein [Pseudomonas moraviensis]MED7666242.1 hypothetical protein [Pseudomonas moraviensis subsp. stanleyae]